MEWVEKWYDSFHKQYIALTVENGCHSDLSDTVEKSEMILS